MKRLIYIVCLLCCTSTLLAQQDNRVIRPVPPEQTTVELDTLIEIGGGSTMVSDTSRIIYYSNLQWKPDPLRSVWFAAIVPGLGQIYNRSYWKLPIVYGGLMACAYAISWNNNRYTSYKQAYRDILTDVELSTDPHRSYNALLREGYTIEKMGGRAHYTAVLKENQNTYHRYRDISIVVGVAVYALSIIDAFVDAQLFDFDISPDLSMHVEPAIQYDLYHNRTTELKLAFTIK